MLNAEPYEFSQAVRQSIIRSLIDLESLVYVIYVNLDDLHPRKVMITNPGDEAPRVVFIDFGDVWFCQLRHHSNDVDVSDPRIYNRFCDGMRFRETPMISETRLVGIGNPDLKRSLHTQKRGSSRRCATNTSYHSCPGISTSLILILSFVHHLQPILSFFFFPSFRGFSRDTTVICISYPMPTPQVIHKKSMGNISSIIET